MTVEDGQKVVNSFKSAFLPIKSMTIMVSRNCETCSTPLGQWCPLKSDMMPVSQIIRHWLKYPERKRIFLSDVMFKRTWLVHKCWYVFMYWLLCSCAYSYAKLMPFFAAPKLGTHPMKSRLLHSMTATQHVCYTTCLLPVHHSQQPVLILI